MSLKTIKFEKMSVFPDISFWEELSRIKLNELLLDTPWLSVKAICQSAKSENYPAKIRLSNDALHNNKLLKDYVKNENNVKIEQVAHFENTYHPIYKIEEMEVQGFLLNFNTLDEFRNYERNLAIKTLLHNWGSNSSSFKHDFSNFSIFSNLNIYDEQFWIDETTIDECYNKKKNAEKKKNFVSPLSKITSFVILSYIDLKKYKAVYSVCTPCIKPLNDYMYISPFSNASSEFTKEEMSWLSQEIYKSNLKNKEINYSSASKNDKNRGEKEEQLEEKENQEKKNLYNFLTSGVFIIEKEFSTKKLKNSLVLYPITELKRLLNIDRYSVNLSYEIDENNESIIKTGTEEKSEKKIYVCFFDLSKHPNALSWPIRNLLFCLTIAFNLYSKQIFCLAFRDFYYFDKSFIIDLYSDLPFHSSNYSFFSNSHFNSSLFSCDTMNSLVMQIKIPPYDKVFNFSSSSCFFSSISSSISSFISSSISSSISSLGSNSSSISSLGSNSSYFSSSLLSFSNSVCSSSSLLMLTDENIVSCWLMARAQSNSSSDSINSSSLPLPLTSVFKINLLSHLDKKNLQNNSVDLNVKLIRWRLLPSFIPQKIQNLKFLLIGIGTLGCIVARNLLGWGVRHITIIDSGRVSLSNPSRQYLYTYEDAIFNNGMGRLKVEAAKKSLSEIWPSIICEGFDLDIPMPGHPRYAMDMKKMNYVHNKLSELILSHDVVFMLTDSRESRWLPSLIIAANQEKIEENPRNSKGKNLSSVRYPLGVSVALGFDTCVIMRHSYMQNKLSCYFCNDVYSPTDSITMRTLDEQCTVTRTGIGNMAGSLAVELIASLSQHENYFFSNHSSHEVCTHNQKNENKNSTYSCLGATPHTIRVSLSDYRIVNMSTEAFVHCICCSKSIIDAYKKNPITFVSNAVKQSKILEEISGLAEMKSCLRENEVLTFDEEGEENKNN